MPLSAGPRLFCRGQTVLSPNPRTGLQGAASEYAPYVDSLPERHDCLLAWSEEERAELKGTGAAALGRLHTLHLIA